ncbi:flagellar motor protein MotB [Planctomycetes bacterium Poly30]|uniref:Flagellar motor protein MotB n=1 Tax=Saltatorellus ferox TaxID=2528018 RepID=A0A518ELL3_9BACT|nr:flagellar motor protein MotB [Planctomycetes bacterium Poly30]
MTVIGEIKVKTVIKKVKTKGAPAYLVSFGDMMTLILCFFILLVAMAKERDFGLMARGIGSFVVQVKSMGLTGVLDAHEKQAIFEQMRRRFNLPPEDDPERRAAHEEAALSELVRAEDLAKLEPHDEVRQPRLASFDPDSDVLDAASRRYIDALVDTLRPRGEQTLSLEGHATDAGPKFQYDNSRLANARARAVLDYLVEEHGFDPGRVRAKAWFAEVTVNELSATGVDARLIIPATAR